MRAHSICGMSEALSLGRGWTVLGETMGRDGWYHGGLVIKGGNNYGVNELEPQPLGWKGKGEIAG